MQDALKEIQRYWDRYAARLEVPGADWASKEFFAEIKSQHDQAYAYTNHILNLPALNGRSLLELGCGIGLDTVEFVRHGAHVTAIDLSPTSIEMARRLLAYHNLNAIFQIGNAEELQYPPNSFDIVVARGILMFTQNPSQLIYQIFRVLRPGGEANITLHNRFSWYVLLAKLSGLNLVGQCEDPPINRLHSIAEARRLFSKFSSSNVLVDRFPEKTNRSGFLPRMYNTLLVPIAQRIPKSTIKAFGYYIIIKALK